MKTTWNFMVAAATLLGGIAVVAVLPGCNPVDLRSLILAAKQPETLLQVEAGDEYVIKFQQQLISVRELEKFGLVPTAKFGDDASATWIYNVYNVAENRFLFPVKVECQEGKIAIIRFPGSVAAALPRNALYGFVASLANSSIDLRAGQTVPDPAITAEIECQVPERTISDCLGHCETARPDANVAEYRYALRLGHGRRAADVLIRCAYRQLPDFFIPTTRASCAVSCRNTFDSTAPPHRARHRRRSSFRMRQLRADFRSAACGVRSPKS